jgi:hypothetical protein
MQTVQIQTRGICQCCGREQAIVNGRMAKHGYTVECGWFSGVCSGKNFVPMQVSRDHTDKLVAQVTKEVGDMISKANRIESGEVKPTTITRNINGRNSLGGKEVVNFADATAYEQKQAVESIVWDLRRSAAMGKDFVTSMVAIADEFHGKELVKVEKKPAAEFIMPRDQKIDAQGNVCICTSVEGARVYFKFDKNGKTYKTWIGSQAWRKLQAA